MTKIVQIFYPSSKNIPNIGNWIDTNYQPHEIKQLLLTKQAFSKIRLVEILEEHHSQWTGNDNHKS